MIDSFKQQGRRKRLVKELEDKGIKDSYVIDSLLRVPRHFFFPKAFEDRAYDDSAFPIDAGQTISQPYTVAFQTQLLELQQGSKVLEIGTGSGYQAAILHEMGVEVHSVERIEELYRKAVELFREMKMDIHCYWGDGSLGLSSKGPYDGIIVTAAAPDLAENLKLQLKVGGKLVLPVGDQHIQKMVLIERLVDNKYRRTEHGDFKFVPLIGKNGWNT